MTALSAWFDRLIVDAIVTAGIIVGDGPCGRGRQQAFGGFVSARSEARKGVSSQDLAGPSGSAPFGMPNSVRAPASAGERDARLVDASRPAGHVIVASVLAGTDSISSRVAGPVQGHEHGLGGGGSSRGSNIASRSNCFSSPIPPVSVVLSIKSTGQLAWSDKSFCAVSK